MYDVVCRWSLPFFWRNWLNLPLHNFADPILHNIDIKNIFAWVYLVSTEQITNRVSLEIIGIGYNSSEMDINRYSGNCLFKVEAENGEAGRRKSAEKDFAWWLNPTQLPL